MQEDIVLVDEDEYQALELAVLSAERQANSRSCLPPHARTSNASLGTLEAPWLAPASVAAASGQAGVPNHKRTATISPSTLRSISKTVVLETSCMQQQPATSPRAPDSAHQLQQLQSCLQQHQIQKQGVVAPQQPGVQRQEREVFLPSKQQQHQQRQLHPCQQQQQQDQKHQQDHMQPCQQQQQQQQQQHGAVPPQHVQQPHGVVQLPPKKQQQPFGMGPQAQKVDHQPQQGSVVPAGPTTAPPQPQQRHHHQQQHHQGQHDVPQQQVAAPNHQPHQPQQPPQHWYPHDAFHEQWRQQAHLPWVSSIPAEQQQEHLPPSPQLPQQQQPRQRTDTCMRHGIDGRQQPTLQSETAAATPAAAAAAAPAAAAAAAAAQSAPPAPSPPPQLQQMPQGSYHHSSRLIDPPRSSSAPPHASSVYSPSTSTTDGAVQQTDGVPKRSAPQQSSMAGTAAVQQQKQQQWRQHANAGSGASQPQRRLPFSLLQQPVTHSETSGWTKGHNGSGNGGANSKGSSTNNLNYGRANGSVGGNGSGSGSSSKSSASCAGGGIGSGAACSGRQAHSTSAARVHSCDGGSGSGTGSAGGGGSFTAHARRHSDSALLSSHGGAGVALEPQLPNATYAGQIIYCVSPVDVDAACARLLASGARTVGFDIEWRSSFKKGQAIGKAALLQLCYHVKNGVDTPPPPDGKGAVCLLLHIVFSGITPKLQELLVREDLLLLGVNIGGDAIKMKADYGVLCSSCVDISDTANGRVLGHLPGVAHCIETKRWSLASLASDVLHLNVPKPNHIRMGNWEARPLSREQRAYAALDAFMGLHLHWVLSDLPKRLRPHEMHMAAVRARAAAAQAAKGPVEEAPVV